MTLYIIRIVIAAMVIHFWGDTGGIVVLINF